MTDSSQLRELRAFREQIRAAGLDRLGVYGPPQTGGDDHSREEAQ